MPSSVDIQPVETAAWKWELASVCSSELFAIQSAPKSGEAKMNNIKKPQNISNCQNHVGPYESTGTNDDSNLNESELAVVSAR